MRVGIDSVEIKRVAKAIEKPAFVKRVYSDEEIELLNGRRAESYAGNFAAKEAFSKALGTGMAGLKWNDISVLRDEKGAPYLKLKDTAEKAAKGLNFTVSITHTEFTATAIVIAY